MRKLLCIPSFILFVGTLQAQSISSDPGRIYSERIFIHTDKSTFVAGDTIWFKAYLFNGNYPGTASTDLFIDFVNETGEVITSVNLPITDATAIGNISLGDSLMHGFYFLRAYTRTIVGQGNGNGVIKAVAVINPDKIPAYYRSRPSVDNRMNFFLESGGFVQGLSNTIIYQATDNYGNALLASGVIFNSVGDTVANFNDASRGLGTFSITPVANEKYQAEIVFKDGSKNKYDLPEAIPEGILLRVAENARGKIFQVEKTGGFRPSGNLTLTGYMFNKVIFRELLKFDGNEANGVIPISNLPEGVLQLAVVDEGQKIWARRPVFVYQPTAPLALSLKTDTLDLLPKGINSFRLLFPDSVEGNFSISVVAYDGEAEMLDNNNIASALLWDAEKQSPVSLQSVETANPGKQQRLINDLLLMTEKQRSLREIDNADNVEKESYIGISGDVFKSGTTKPVTKGDLLFLVQTKDSSGAFLQASIEKDGTFQLNNLVFDDMAKFHYQLSGKNAMLVDIRLKDPGERFKLNNKMPPVPLLPRDRMTIIDSGSLKKWAEHKNFLITSARGKMLGEVVVSSKLKRPVDIVNKNYSTGMFASMNATVFDFVNEAPKPASEHILEWLRGKVAGLFIVLRNGHYELTSTRAMSITGGPIPVQIFLNEMPVEPDQILTLTVGEVALVKYFKAGSNMMAGFGISGKLAIYTRAPQDINYGDLLNSKDFIYRGYTPVQEFTVKDQPGDKTEKDGRTTLYWNPQATISADSNEFPIRFINSDRARKFKITVQGFTYDGRLINFQKIVD